MNIDILFVGGLVLIALGLLVRKFVKGGIIRQIMAIAMVFGVFVVLSHTLVPYAVTAAAVQVPVSVDVITGVILGLVGVGMRTQRRDSMAVFAPIYMSIGIFVVLLNLVMPYMSGLSDWSTTIPI